MAWQLGATVTAALIPLTVATLVYEELESKEG